MIRVFIGLVLIAVISSYVDGLKNKTPLKIGPNDVTIVKGKSKTIDFSYDQNLGNSTLHLWFNTTKEVQLSPQQIDLTNNAKISITITGLDVTSETFIDIRQCNVILNERSSNCTFNTTEAYARVVVVHSNVISVLVTITGWIYFFAWSISFWPQIILNFQRRSVVGLTFDYVVLNIIGFTCYTVYNLLLYCDESIQDDYEDAHPRSLIPVLLNDVLFASHAFVACIIVGVQVLIFEKANQRVSYICIALSVALIIWAFVVLALCLFKVIGWLQFIMHLSYIKMVVTLSKYVPQVLLNWRRKCTVGWSIGNVLFDFTGGFMDIAQMVLQAINTADWSGFYGDPVKFGLGLVSMVFDVIFMVQHYCLYPDHTDTEKKRILEQEKGEDAWEISGSRL